MPDIPTPIYTLFWAALMILSVGFIYGTWGNAQLVQMFPEGRRWWMPWARLAALAAFAAVVLVHPFAGAVHA